MIIKGLIRRKTGGLKDCPAEIHAPCESCPARYKALVLPASDCLGIPVPYCYRAIIDTSNDSLLTAECAEARLQCFT